MACCDSIQLCFRPTAVQVHVLWHIRCMLAGLSVVPEQKRGEELTGGCGVIDHMHIIR